jgi:XTP/dITP diphosphohydrolase
VRPDALIFASGNRNKYAEMAELLAPTGLKILFGGDVASLDVEETGFTYAGNALLKARAWAERTGIPAVADDSGVEVRALDWAPGIYSARMAATDVLRNEWLLGRLSEREEETPGEPDRRARYVAALALCVPDGTFTLICEGTCWGRILREPRGGGGFGYDPLFAPDGYERSFGELDRSVKQRISHRAIASFRLVNMLLLRGMLQ